MSRTGTEGLKEGPYEILSDRTGILPDDGYGASNVSTNAATGYANPIRKEQR
jgi:hypothetical protein